MRRHPVAILVTRPLEMTPRAHLPSIGFLAAEQITAARATGAANGAGTFSIGRSLGFLSRSGRGLGSQPEMFVAELREGPRRCFWTGADPSRSLRKL